MGSKNKITHKSFCADPTMTITLTLQFLYIKPLTNISFCHNYVYSASVQTRSVQLVQRSMTRTGRHREERASDGQVMKVEKRRR